MIAWRKRPTACGVYVICASANRPFVFNGSGFRLFSQEGLDAQAPDDVARGAEALVCQFLLFVTSCKGTPVGESKRLAAGIADVPRQLYRSAILSFASSHAPSAFRSSARARNRSTTHKLVPCSRALCTPLIAVSRAFPSCPSAKYARARIARSGSTSDSTADRSRRRSRALTPFCGQPAASSASWSRSSS